MAPPESEIWLRNSPPRYCPTAPTRSHQPDPSSSPIATMNSALSHNLAVDRHRPLRWCSFQVPSSDSLIHADSREGVPVYSVPNESEGFTIVRRYLYDVLTGTGWGISDKYPAAIRATVEGWYGHGGYFRAQCAAQDGLLDLCPKIGKDENGNEVSFDERLREQIKECVRYESSVLLHREVKLEEATLAEDTYVDATTPDVAVQDKILLRSGEEKYVHPVFRPSPNLNQAPTITAPLDDQRDGLRRVNPSHPDTARPSRNLHQEELPTGYKHRRYSLTPPVKNLAGADQQMIHKKRVKAIEHRLGKSHSMASIRSIKSVRYETLPQRQPPPIKDQHQVVEAAAVAKRVVALNLNADEARLLNHHGKTVERKKGDIVSRMLARLGGKKG